jgi:hypothetical protein
VRATRSICLTGSPARSVMPFSSYHSRGFDDDVIDRFVAGENR